MQSSLFLPNYFNPEGHHQYNAILNFYCTNVNDDILLNVCVVVKRSENTYSGLCCDFRLIYTSEVDQQCFE